MSAQVDSQTNTVRMDKDNGDAHNPFLYRTAESHTEMLLEASELGIGAVT